MPVEAERQHQTALPFRTGSFIFKPFDIQVLTAKGEHTMFTIEKSIFINRPQQEVFDFASEPANIHKWQGNFISAEWASEGQHGVGSTQRSVSRFLGRDIESTSQVTVWDPPNRHAFKVVSGPVPVEGDMKFETEGNGTKLTMSGQVEAGGFFKLTEGLVKKQLESQFVTNLEALKLLLEAGSE
jgi:uncharacterized membrane protein